MTGASGQRILVWLCGLAAVTAAGCADLDFLPSWVPFQSPAADQLPGVVAPAERIAELRKLADKASTLSSRGEAADLGAVGRVDSDREGPADSRGDHSCLR